ncbi:beta-arrestin-1-like isoform X2 [Portunus trituberculatus]|uniref:beta-arrestin-1-like isoform X2 n=1 Tax=Portunus trituberculatus TaxID=210409 RepID=UPI001E1CC05B|nr:beta-arrestin-1-like isoform X2 [Portunus trituberculatus]
MDDNSKRQGTRVFKKSSPNGKITVYLGKRDFVDHITHVDPIDGVVLIDPEYLKDRKVFGHVLAAFRYGREDLDVLGLTFRKDLYLASEQIYPLDTANKRALTRLQERLIKKLGPNAFPFFFELPPHCPASVTLQPAPGDMGKPCGVDYELKAYVGDNVEDKPHKRNSVRLAIRKVMYAPMKQGDQPSVEVSKEFMMSPNKLHLEASLDKELYYHGETVAVNVHIQNNSNKSVKKIKVSIRQFADICLFSTAQYKCTVAEVESEDGCPVGPGFTLSKVLHLTPLLLNNKDKRGLALDGQLKHEDTNLASSSIITDSSQKENLGIIVQYKVKVKLILGPLVGDLVAELPFTLMHPKPEEEPENNKTTAPTTSSPTQDSESTPPVDTNLIELDTHNCSEYTSVDQSHPVGGDTFKIQSLIGPLRAKLEQVMERLGVGREGPQVSPHPVIHNPHACEGTLDSSSPLKPATPQARERIVDLIDLNEEADSLWVFSRTCMCSGCCVVWCCSVFHPSLSFKLYYFPSLFLC